MTSTTTPPLIVKTLAEVKGEAFAEANAVTKQLRTRLLLKAILKCAGNGLEESDERVRTALKLKHSVFEDLNKIQLAAKVGSSAVTDWFEVGRHYVLQVHVPRREGKDLAKIATLDEEILAGRVQATLVGRGAPRREEGPLLSVLTLEMTGFKVKIEREDAGELADLLEAAEPYRLALMRAPEWLENVDTRRIEDERAAARNARPQPPGTQPIPFPPEGEDEDMEEED